MNSMPYSLYSALEILYQSFLYPLHLCPLSVLHHSFLFHHSSPSLSLPCIPTPHSFSTFPLALYQLLPLSVPVLLLTVLLSLAYFRSPLSPEPLPLSLLSHCSLP